MCGQRVHAHPRAGIVRIFFRPLLEEFQQLGTVNAQLVGHGGAMR